MVMRKLLLNKARTETKKWIRSARVRSARMALDVRFGVCGFKSTGVNATLLLAADESSSETAAPESGAAPRVKE
jgi:hypothetical protein